MIKVILKNDVVGLGCSGEIKLVKDGYARNYLLPQQLALLASESNLKTIEMQQKKLQAKELSEFKKAQEFAVRLENLSVTITVEVNEEGRLYGSLTAPDIAKAISAEGIDIDKKSIILNAPLKELGIYDISVKLHPQVSAKVKIWIVKS